MWKLIALKLSRNTWNWDTISISRGNTLRVCISTAHFLFRYFSLVILHCKALSCNLYPSLDLDFLVVLQSLKSVQRECKSCRLAFPSQGSADSGPEEMTDISVRLSSWKMKQTLEISCLIYPSLIPALFSWIFNKKSFNTRVLTWNSYPNMYSMSQICPTDFFL